MSGFWKKYFWIPKRLEPRVGGTPTRMSGPFQGGAGCYKAYIGQAIG